MVFRYGPLATKDIEQLVECHNQAGKFGCAETIYANVGEAVNRLSHTHHLISFSSISGLWYMTHDENFHQPKTNKVIHPKSDAHFPEIIDPANRYFPQIGTGSDFVYVVYSRDHRIDSIVNQRQHFPLKVGRTNNINRRIAQLSESGPNNLTIGLIMKTDDATSLERFIHKKLHQQGQHLDIPGRKEWFLSNLAQVTIFYKDFLMSRR